MSPFDDPLEILSDLKGAPLSCLVAMQLVEAPVKASFLVHAAGYSPREIRDALEFLWVFGFVERLPQGAWRLAYPATTVLLPPSRQVPVPLSTGNIQ
jgi:hypothetical protein